MAAGRVRSIGRNEPKVKPKQQSHHKSQNQHIPSDAPINKWPINSRTCVLNLPDTQKYRANGRENAPSGYISRPLAFSIDKLTSGNTVRAITEAVTYVLRLSKSSFLLVTSSPLFRMVKNSFADWSRMLTVTDSSPSPSTIPTFPTIVPGGTSSSRSKTYS